MIDDGRLYAPSLGKKMKRQIDHRLTLIERAAGEMVALVPGHSMQPPLRDMRAIAESMKFAIEQRTRKPKT